jgi:hypothetical protein
MDDTGLAWQQALGDWWQGENPGCAKRCIRRVPFSATGSSGDKSAA